MINGEVLKSVSQWVTWSVSRSIIKMIFLPHVNSRISSGQRNKTMDESMVRGMLLLEKTVRVPPKSLIKSR